MINNGRVSAIIVAAGEGRRFGSGEPKAFVKLTERTILETTIQRFRETKLIDEIVVILSRRGLELAKEKGGLDGVSKVSEGGKERKFSVKKGFSLIDRATEIVVVHDGVRPLVSPELIERVVFKADEMGAAIAGVPAFDTLKEVSNSGVIKGTIDRSKIFQARTPQAFRYSLLEKIYAEPGFDDWDATDEAMLLERVGFPVSTVAGDRMNIKITTREDLELARTFLARRGGTT